MQRAISKSMRAAIDSASWIRQMFEEGNRLRALHGADAVFDFTLGNPSAPPPDAFRKALRELASQDDLDHRYMPNAGYPDTRARVAAGVASAHGVPIEPRDVFMTCGAAGALNCLFKSVLEPGDEVIVLTPYFPEYRYYIENHGGRCVEVPTDADFQPDIEALAAAMTSRTRALLLNSPNNPTGVIYDEDRIARLGELVDAREGERPCFLVSDEPYRRVVYVDKPHGSVLAASRWGIVATSFSKDLGLAGERIGFLAFSERLPCRDELAEAIPVALRILGFVNAPALMQRVVAECLDASVDVEIYRRNRDLLHGALTDAGYRMPAPEGAFFLFPAAPGGDDVAFCAKLRESNVLVVPGSGFGTPGHFRLSYAVPDAVVDRALPLLVDAARRLKP